MWELPSDEEKKGSESRAEGEMLLHLIAWGQLSVLSKLRLRVQRCAGYICSWL